MASCEKVHDWIKTKGFETHEDAIRFIKDDYPNRSDNPNLYECIDLYDFEFEYVVYYHYGKPQLHRRYRKAQTYHYKRHGKTYTVHLKAFVSLGLEPPAIQSVLDHMRSLAGD